MSDNQALRKLIRQELLRELRRLMNNDPTGTIRLDPTGTINELHVSTGWFRKSVRTLLPTIGFDPYMIWNRSYNDSFTKRRLEAIENVHHAFKQVWMSRFNQEVDPDVSELAYKHAAKNWRAVWTAAGKDEEKAKKRMLQRLVRLYIDKKRARHYDPEREEH